MRRLAVAILVSSSIAAGAATAQTPSASAGNPFGSGRATLSAEAVFMWFKASPTPVPVITDGYADLPSTAVLLGGGTLDTNPNPGFRITGSLCDRQPLGDRGQRVLHRARAARAAA